MNIWPKLKSFDDAKKVCRGVSFLSFVTGSLGIIMALLNKVPPEAIADGVITIVCGVFLIRKQSRIAAIVLLVLAVLNTAYNALNGLPAGILSLTMIVFYIAGLRAAFASQKLKVSHLIDSNTQT